MSSKIKVAIAGNPNVGKSVIFNALTGARQHVGNWAGKTVEKKSGNLKYQNHDIEIIDLPGTYSLTAYSPEEVIARNFILDEKPDVVIHIVDSTNLERNLYLTLQLLELDTPVVLVLNISDMATKEGLIIDEKMMSELLHIPVVKTVGSKKIGINKLLDEVVKVSKTKFKRKNLIKYKSKNREEIVDMRYGFIAGLLRETVVKTKMDKIKITERIDNVLTHKILGIPLFLFIVWLLFKITFTLSAPIMYLIDSFFLWLGDFVTQLVTVDWLSSLLVDGVIGGLGAIFIFIPQIFLLFLFISLLEDSGYLARAAFIMDKLMHKIGLHGKSFIPMLLGFGCNVPAIMATRTLSNKKDRLQTMFMIPFMSCSARLPIYILFTSAFFPAHQDLVVFSLYILGIIIGILMGFVLNKTALKGLASPFVMELPPYRLPTLKSALLHMWRRGFLFIKKAGKIIFIAVIFIWIAANLPFGVEYASQESLIGQIGTLLAPLFKPLGFGTWQVAVALLFGFLAKESIVGIFGALYGASELALSATLQTQFSPLAAYAFLIFVLLYMPCMAVIGVIKRETNSWKWPLFVAVYTTVIAWIAAFAVYQGGQYLF